MATQRMEGEDQESIIINMASPSTALYYVQSPSTVSHANSYLNHSSESALLSPSHHDHDSNFKASRFALMRYSSSRGSINSFVGNDKKVNSHEVSILKSGRLKIVKKIGDDDDDIDGDDDDDDGESRNGIWRYIALDPTGPAYWFVFQIIWRLMISIGVALLVFFLVTKPPSPKVSTKVKGFKQFNLGEGLDNTGVGTKILSINCSVDMVIDNNSKVFRLLINHPTLEMDFLRMKLARSQGPELYVDSKSSKVLRLCISIEDRPVYGAGRSMQDMLESKQGLPLTIRVSSRSRYRVVWNLIRQKYLHYEECKMILRSGANHEKNHIHFQSSTCTSSTYPA